MSTRSRAHPWFARPPEECERPDAYLCVQRLWLEAYWPCELRFADMLARRLEAMRLYANSPH